MNNTENTTPLPSATGPQPYVVVLPAKTKKGKETITSSTRRVIQALQKDKDARNKLRRLDMSYDFWRPGAKPQRTMAQHVKAIKQLRTAEHAGIRKTTGENYMAFLQTVVPHEYLQQLLQFMPSFHQLPEGRQRVLAKEARHFAMKWLISVQLEGTLYVAGRGHINLTFYRFTRLLASRGFTLDLTDSGINILFGGTPVTMPRHLRATLMKALGRLAECPGPIAVGTIEYKLLVVHFRWYSYSNLTDSIPQGFLDKHGAALLALSVDELHRIVDEAFTHCPVVSQWLERASYIRSRLVVRRPAAGAPLAALPVPR